MNKKDNNTFMLSILSGLLIVLIVNGGATILDNMGLDEKLSTFIALVVGLMVNFIMQFKIFVTTSKNNFTYMILSYLFTDILILIINQLTFNYGVDNEKDIKKYLPTILQNNYLLFIRLTIGGFVWCIVSYPLRRYWVFV